MMRMMRMRGIREVRGRYLLGYFTYLARRYLVLTEGSEVIDTYILHTALERDIIGSASPLQYIASYFNKPSYIYRVQYLYSSILLMLPT
ncbi:hypothetical protein EYC84_010889 [Monilinia fructicola]|uniref:Uncharacterized protein n=1 Tax=Monilinia fructicola TaxID=38448 RepID=A0A5M9JBA0_MONFR|nr:hypothetical protein EYC84_010889 [Monilinia fructicola]